MDVFERIESAERIPHTTTQSVERLWGFTQQASRMRVSRAILMMGIFTDSVWPGRLGF